MGYKRLAIRRAMRMHRKRRLEELKQRGRLWAIRHHCIAPVVRIYHVLGWKF